MRRLALAAAVGAVGVALARRPRARETGLRGQVALVTGASRGLGFLLARELAHEGCRLVICARTDSDLQRARADLVAEGADVTALACDVTDREAVARLVEETRRRVGPVDILVNNASIMLVGPAATLTHADFEAALANDFWSVVNPTLAVLPAMRARGSGRVVNITSIGGKVSVPHLLAYGSAKFAAVGFSEGLAAEVARDGVHVVTVVPGLMRTGSYLRAWFEGRPEEEFTWFSLGATLPVISMDAERAARRIVHAIKRGEREPILSLPAQALARIHGLFPGTVIAALALVNRLLPRPGAPVAARSGLAIDRQRPRPLLRAVTSLGRSAARRLRQYPASGVAR